MSTQSRTNLKANSQTGDIITQDLLDSIIDSGLNLVDVTAQTVTSPITTPLLAASTISADAAYITSLFVQGVNTNQNPLIEFYQDVTANVSAATSGTFVSVDVPTSTRTNHSFTVTSGKATYVGSVTAYFKIDYRVTLKDKYNAMEDNLQIAVNGSAVPSSPISFLGSTGHTVQATQCVAQLKPNDFFQLQINVKTTSESWWEVDRMNCVAFPIYWG